MLPLISIVVPVYNVEKYLGTCLDSILNQTYKNIEVVLIDDGSTDSSGEICDLYEKEDRRIRVIHKKNGGLSDARNRGVESVKGEYITFVDSDDIISYDMIKALFNLLNDTGADIAVCDPVHVFNQGKPKYVFSKSRTILETYEAICEMWYQKSFFASAWGKLYKTELFCDIRFKEGIVFEDVQIMHKVFERASKIVYTPSKLYGYLHREGSITMGAFSKKDTEILQICDELMQFSQTRSKELYKAAKAYCVVGSLRVYLNAPRNGEYDDSIEYSVNNLKRYAKEVFQDKNIRRKTKMGLLLYLYCKPIMHIIYSNVNRWK